MGLLSKLKRSLSKRSLKHPPRIDPAELPAASTTTTTTATPTGGSTSTAVPASSPAVPETNDDTTASTPAEEATPAPAARPPKSRRRPRRSRKSTEGEAAAATAATAAAASTSATAPTASTAPTATAAPEPAAAAPAPKPAAARQEPSPSVATGEEATKEEEAKAQEAELLASAAKVFGRDNASRLGSAKWSERNFAIASIHENLRGIGGGAGTGTGLQAYSMEEFFGLTVDTVARCAKDKVAPVFFSAVSLYCDLLDAYGSAVDAVQVRDALLRLIPCLVRRMGNSNTRIQREACNAVLQTARCASLGGIAAVSPSLVNDELPIRPRLTILRILVPETKLAKRTPLNLAAVMSVATPALRIADTKTRKAAVGLVVACYKVSGRRVKRHLTNIKPAMLRILQREFQAAGGSSSTSSSASRASGSALPRRAGRRTKSSSSSRAAASGSENAHAKPKRHASVGAIGNVAALKSPAGAVKPPLLSRDRSAYLAPIAVSPLGESRLNRTASAPAFGAPPSPLGPAFASGPSFGAAESIFNLSAANPASGSRSPAVSPLRMQAATMSMRAVADPLEARYFDDDEEQLMDDILACI